MLVTVYGTLKMGYGNHGRLRGADYVTDCIVRGFKLYNSGFPVAAHSDYDCIRGEIYDIKDDLGILAGLDGLEGYREHDPDRSMYLRKTVKAHGTDAKDYETFMYVGNESFWDNFNGMRECTYDNDGLYQWGKPEYALY